MLLAIISGLRLLGFPVLRLVSGFRQSWLVESLGIRLGGRGGRVAGIRVLTSGPRFVWS